MNDLTPEPPKLIRTIEWFRLNWHKYILHIVLIISISYNLFLRDKINHLETEGANYINLTNSKLIDYRGCKTKSPWGDPPLQINFSDGEVAYVNFFHPMEINPEKIDSAAKIYPRPHDALEAMLVDIKSKTYSVLEQYTSEYARKNRLSIAEEILEMTKAMQDRTALTIRQFDLLEFCSPSEIQPS